jgi:hypothetical protein
LAGRCVGRVQLPSEETRLSGRRGRGQTSWAKGCPQDRQLWVLDGGEAPGGKAVSRAGLEPQGLLSTEELPPLSHCTPVSSREAPCVSSDSEPFFLWGKAR